MEHCIIPLRKRWEVHTFDWGSGVRDAYTDKWVEVFISPDAQAINVEALNVILHENGIEFV